MNLKGVFHNARKRFEVGKSHYELMYHMSVEFQKLLDSEIENHSLRPFEFVFRYSRLPRLSDTYYSAGRTLI